MRKIDVRVSEAFRNSIPMGSTNTTIKVEDGVTEMYLHGHLIAKKSDGVLKITSAGYPTNVTKARLNTIEGVSIFKRKGQLFLNNKKWNGEWTTI